MVDLADMNCVTPKKLDNPLVEQEIKDFLHQIPDWMVINVEDINRLRREFKFESYRQALDFSLRVGEMAEEQDHHPMILTEWGKVTVTWWTHFIKGLHQNDFITAAKSDKIYEELI